MASPLKPRDFKRVKLHKWHTTENPTSSLIPCIVWWKKGNEPDGYWFKGELLCRQFPNGEVVALGDTLDTLIDRLYTCYLDLFYEEDEE
jgi:hypothetical protein